MAHEIRVPRLGWSMEEGTFVRWLKQDGDTVKPGDAIFELEGEKAAQDIEAVDGGILRIPSNAPKPGTVVAVGAVIGYLAAEGEQIGAAPASGQAQQAQQTPVAPVTVAAQAVAAAPSIRRMAREMGVSLAQVVGSGPAGKIMARDVRSAEPRPARQASNASSTIASPRARRIARELGIDWTRIAGTGRGGRVRERDVRQATASDAMPTTVAGAGSAVSKLRRTIADRMLASHQNTAPVTLTTRVDATNLVSLRQQFKSAGGTVPSYTDIIIKLISLVLPDHPSLMSQWTGNEIITPNEINIGVAVDTPAGLIVPVIKDLPSLSLLQVAEVSSKLIDRARAGQLKQNDFQGGVFTVTNLGSFGIDAFTPIINSPESAILGLGRIRREPAVVDDQIVARDQMTLSLTFDHRIVDGAPAARFLQAVAQAIESPSAWLLRSP